MLTSEDKTLIGSAFPFWEKLSHIEKEEFLHHASLNTYAKNSPIHNADLECIGILYVKKGSLRVYMMSEDGREITLYRIGSGEICALSASCVLNSITFDVYVDAVSDCELIQICSSYFSKLMEQNVYVEVFTYKLIAEHFSEVMWTMQQILFMSFDRRLAIFLLDESASSKKSELKMTHEEIARLMGSAREVVTRMLKYFSSEGWVELGRGSVKIVDRSALSGLI
ncbi:Crp/Fnr family transcriptional regulator [Bariatricus massiliensis]|uniref:Crp/Fnr family transcriptional regulator n=1 Tax=Bariatricus massiliensis TaxID=1745713 RepID=A0ABS8DEB6_9FIRM|nr:Crp/Fnr family transcriptional regulator [Bariatricus massiliensis]MCB7302881.1 Crp/Fnr family transcriptional regulator [Bariatricus massiliensis]MCB7374097.1 Crp/Fnr family transcriptional regulator [Bariatricus massiliensis]MCB7386767.1 Crp/Fnr family transcriptional regulator [Bariatricus massiliensis]MCB7410929.1 Crp/Fnr family transcriptional regulator [Bariatricus massiliensis]MCQ5251755.1 Crp/Fnr family transcriptional regulator [Bariatricus massiliensis]